MDMSDSIEQTPCELIFDLDGTLTDPALGFVRSVNFSLESHGISPVEEDDLKKFIGPPLDGAFREILHLDQDKDVSSFVSKYRERYSEVGFSENILYDGILDVLVALRGLGFRLGVCTSKRVDFAEKILALFNIGRSSLRLWLETRNRRCSACMDCDRSKRSLKHFHGSSF